MRRVNAWYPVAGTGEVLRWRGHGWEDLYWLVGQQSRWRRTLRLDPRPRAVRSAERRSRRYGETAPDGRKPDPAVVVGRTLLARDWVTIHVEVGGGSPAQGWFLAGISALATVLTPFAGPEDYLIGNGNCVLVVTTLAHRHRLTTIEHDSLSDVWQHMRDLQRRLTTETIQDLCNDLGFDMAEIGRSETQA